MNTPYDDQQGSSGPDPYQRPGTREPGQDVPRQQPPYGEQPGSGQGAYGEQAGYGQQGYGQQHGSASYGGYTPYPGGPDQAYEAQGGYGYPSGPPGKLSYLNGAPVGFSEAVIQGLRHLLTFRGRASRSAFWWFVLFTVIVQVAIDIFVGLGTRGSRGIDSPLGIISTLLTLSLSIRRLHDADHTGWWWLIGLVPFVGWIVLLIFYVQRGTRGPNRFSVPL